MTATRPLGAVLRRSRSDLETIWMMADSWVALWAERLDPTPPPLPPDNVVPFRQNRLQLADGGGHRALTKPGPTGRS